MRLRFLFVDHGLRVYGTYDFEKMKDFAFTFDASHWWVDNDKFWYVAI